MAAAVDALTAFFETLTPAALDGIGLVYAPQARFKDPFNEVQGLDAIAGVYRHMFASLQNPHFDVTGRVLQGNECFLTWNFCFCFQGIQPGVQQTVRGWERGAFEIHFPKRFTHVMKLLRLLPYQLYFPAVRRMTGL